MGSTSSDCSRGICSIYCPQWCYIVFPPPPPEDFLLKDGDNSSPVLSPMIVALIGILAGVFLLLTYYTIISKYCVERRRNVAENTNPDQIRENQSQGNSFQVATTPGLDQSAITSIAVFKYKKEEGLIEGTDCSVCLNEFQEEESLRILPKCTHAFHLPCIDPWLKSNSSCPICRAVISPMANFPAPSDPRQRTMDGRLSALQRHRGDDTVLVVHDCVQEGVITILMRPETEVSGNWQLRRPVPMDSTSRGRQQLLVADVLRSGEDREGDTSREYGKPGGGTLDSMKG